MVSSAAVVDTTPAAVGKWPVDPGFAEQLDPRAERRHRVEVLVGQRVVGVVDSNTLLSRQISGRAGDSVAFELLLFCI
jgi:hypothetical protein